MNDYTYKFGVYFNRWQVGQQFFGFGIVWETEKYIHFNLFNFELAIGYTR